MKAFNTAYAVQRLKGVIAMLEDAASEQEAGEAIAHLETVHRETVESALEAGIYAM